MEKEITLEDIASFQRKLANDQKAKTARRAVNQNGIKASAVDPEVQRNLIPVFSDEVKTGSVLNQRHSGRCWMFAGTNVIREIIAEKLNVEDLELSEAYLQFYDRLEKANFFLERAIEGAHDPYDSRLNRYNLSAAVSDGGHFAFFVNLVRKYGVLPYQAMPDLSVSKSTDDLNAVLLELYATFLARIHAMAEQGWEIERMREAKKDMLLSVYRVLSIALGEPPHKFAFEYQDKDKKFHRLPALTGQEFFAKYVEDGLEQYVCLSNSEMIGYDMGVKYASRYVNNVEGDDPVSFFDVPVNELKKAVIASIQGGEPVWFAADVTAQSLRKEGQLGEGLLRYDELFGIDLSLSKGEKLSYGSTMCNHAMSFTGVNLVHKKPNRWKVENSWGDEVGKKGYFVMDDAWFDSYVYEVFVERKYVDPAILKQMDESKTVYVEPWSNMWAELD